ncbi:hypothetical protein V1478_009531 [Vespula squamosa]|uniref:Uncharacterized protein n=1 Tax=Vespula squamosa TaxID=30214 RepID=A0ABD2APX7_VESSQ
MKRKERLTKVNANNFVGLTLKISKGGRVNVEGCGRVQADFYHRRVSLVQTTELIRAIVRFINDALFVRGKKRVGLSHKASKREKIRNDAFPGEK